MAEIIPFPRRGAEILRTIGGPSKGPYAVYIERNGKRARLSGPFRDLSEAESELTKLQLRSNPDTKLTIGSA